MPTFSIISKSQLDKPLKRVNKFLKLNSDEFLEKNCTYMFDISEPRLFFSSIVAPSDWTVEWYLYFNSSFENYDFLLNWQFVENVLSKTNITNKYKKEYKY